MKTKEQLIEEIIENHDLSDWDYYQDALKDVINAAIANTKLLEAAGWVRKEEQVNNCDGCQINDKLEGIYHVNKLGDKYMICQKGRYNQPLAPYPFKKFDINPPTTNPIATDSTTMQPTPNPLDEIERWAQKGLVKCTIGIIAGEKYTLGYNGALTDLLTKIQSLKKQTK